MVAMAKVALFPVLLLLVILMASQVTSKRCKYDKKSAEWSPCDPTLKVKTKLLSLVKGNKDCPDPKTMTRPCKAGLEMNGCMYVAVSSWSECDQATRTRTRTLELQSQASEQCANNELESKGCRGKSSHKTRGSGKKKKRKHRKSRKKHKKGGRRCKYKKGKWGACDPVERRKVRVSTLRRGPASCQQQKEHSRRCNPDKGRKGKGKKSKKGKGRKKKKHRKGRRKVKKNRKVVDDMHPAPPKLTEMRVWPLSSSVEVSWKPPDQGPVRGYQLGYGISIPDVYKVDVNASVLHYVINDLEPEQEYIVSVRARNKAGLGSPLYETVRTGRDKDSGGGGQLLLAPVAVKAATVSPHSMLVTWTDSSILKLRGGVDEGAGKHYTVRYMQLNHLSKGDKPLFVMVNTTESSLLVEGLMPYTRYEFAVRVSHGSARSVWSIAVTNTTFAAAPSSKPADFTADIEQDDPTTVTLTWQPPDQPNGPITGYVIFYSKDPILPDADWARLEVRGDRLTTKVQGLDPNAAYFFKIQAGNKQGVGPTTAPVTVTVPDVLPSMPRNLTTEDLEHNPSAVMLRWQRPEKENEPITGYMIFYTDDPNLSEGSWVVHKVGADQLTNTITDLRPSARYFFKLQARNKAGHSPSTPPISHTLPDMPPTVPRNVTVTQFAELPAAVIVSWLPPEDLGHPITGYVVSHREDSSQQWSVDSVEGDTLTLILPSLQPDTRYTFTVQARTDHWLGPSSPSVHYSTPPDPSGQLKAPTDVLVYILSSSSAVMSWRDPMSTLGLAHPSSGATSTTGQQDGGDNLSSTYTVRYRAVFGSEPPYTFSNYTYLSPPYFPSLYLVDLSPSTHYQFSVRLNRGSNLHSPWSEPVFNKTLEAAPSSPPADVKVEQAEDDPAVLTVSWNPPLESNGVITGYMVFSSKRRKQPIRGWDVEVVDAHQTHLTVRGLAPSTRYFFRLQARNAQGFGPLSSPQSYKTPAVHGGKAEDVTVVASPDDPYSAMVSWQPPSSRKGQISYYILTCLEVDAEVAKRLEVPGHELTAVVRDLLPARIYRFTVQPHYSEHTGPHSNPVDYVVPKELLEDY